MRSESKIFSIATLYLIFDALIVSLFTYSAFVKITGFQAFSIRFSRIPVIYHTNTWYLSYAIVALEVLIPVLILTPSMRKFGLRIVTSILIVFTMFLISKEIDASTEPCMCGGILESLSLRQHIIFNLFFITISILMLFKTEK
jgi:hypothetical protein